MDWTNPPSCDNARLLDSWLATVGNVSNCDTLRNGWTLLRDRHRRHAAIDVRVELGQLRFSPDGMSAPLRNRTLRALQQHVFGADYCSDERDHQPTLNRSSSVSRVQHRCAHSNSRQ